MSRGAISDMGVKGGKTQNGPWQCTEVIKNDHTHTHTPDIFVAFWKLHKERDPSKKSIILLVQSPHFTDV